MPFGPTAIMPTKTIEASGLTQREVADRVGLRQANIISMLKTGETRVPLDRIPALFQTRSSVRVATVVVGNCT